MNRINPNDVPKFTLASGVEIPVVGMGTFGNDRFTPEQVSAAVKGAALAGYRLFDCAAAYQNEPDIGVAFQQAMAEGGIRRGAPGTTATPSPTPSWWTSSWSPGGRWSGWWTWGWFDTSAFPT